MVISGAKQIRNHKKKLVMNSLFQSIEKDFSKKQNLNRTKLFDCLKSEAIPRDGIVMKGRIKDPKDVLDNLGGNATRGTKFKGVTKNGANIW